jgi:Protein of unknown function (DUF3176)
MPARSNVSYSSDLQNLIPSNSPTAIASEENVSIEDLGRCVISRKAPRRFLIRLRPYWMWLVANSWTLEYVALAVTTASLDCIGIVLGVYSGQATTTWKHPVTLNASLNASLSFLATILKGSMLFPVGSCLGQLKWVWYH